MLKIVVGGQIDKKHIAAIVSEYFKGRAQIDIMGDLEAAMAMQNGQYHYYIGACNTGGGGALALAIALLGSDSCATISMPGRIFTDEQIISEVQKGKTAFGFTAEHAEKVLAVLLPAIDEKRGEK